MRLYLLQCAINPEPRRQFDGKKILWQVGRFVGANRTPLSNYKPSVTTQHNVRGRAKGGL